MRSDASAVGKRVAGTQQKLVVVVLETSASERKGGEREEQGMDSSGTE